MRRTEVTVEAGVEPDVAVEFIPGLEGGVGDAVDANELGGDSLADLGVVVGFTKDGQPGVGVEVDEAGADDASGGVDGAGGFEVGGVAAVDGNAVILDGNGGVEAGAAGAVEDLAIGDEEVEHY